MHRPNDVTMVGCYTRITINTNVLQYEYGATRSFSATAQLLLSLTLLYTFCKFCFVSQVFLPRLGHSRRGVVCGRLCFNFVTL